MRVCDPLENITIKLPRKYHASQTVPTESID